MTISTTKSNSIWAEPRWNDEADLYLGPKLPVPLIATGIATVIVLSAVLALCITVAMGF